MNSAETTHEAHLARIAVRLAEQIGVREAGIALQVLRTELFCFDLGCPYRQKMPDEGSNLPASFDAPPPEWQDSNGRVSNPA